jgi:hypothetical protein
MGAAATKDLKIESCWRWKQNIPITTTFFGSDVGMSIGA